MAKKAIADVGALQRLFENGGNAMRVWLAVRGWDLVKNSGNLSAEKINWNMTAQPDSFQPEEIKAIVRAARDMAKDLEERATVLEGDPDGRASS